ncbi:126_t:CDS:2, partial [Scutellospora calospora]
TKPTTNVPSMSTDPLKKRIIGIPFGREYSSEFGNTFGGGAILKKRDGEIDGNKQKRGVNKVIGSNKPIWI